MRTSEQINEIATALAKAQGEIESAAKDSKNPHFNTKYADLASVRAAIKTPLSANGIAVIQGVSTSEAGVHIETMLAHTSGQFIAETLTIPLGNKRDAQAVGSAVSYGRRYALMAIVGVAADDDDDGNIATQNAPERGKEPARQQSRPAPQQRPADDDDVDPEKEARALAYMAGFRTRAMNCATAEELTTLWNGDADARAKVMSPHEVGQFAAEMRKIKEQLIAAQNQKEAA